MKGDKRINGERERVTPMREDREKHGQIFLGWERGKRKGTKIFGAQVHMQRPTRDRRRGMHTKVWDTFLTQTEKKDRSGQCDMWDVMNVFLSLWPLLIRKGNRRTGLLRKGTTTNRTKRRSGWPLLMPLLFLCLPVTNRDKTETEGQPQTLWTILTHRRHRYDIYFLKWKPQPITVQNVNVCLKSVLRGEERERTWRNRSVFPFSLCAPSSLPFSGGSMFSLFLGEGAREREFQGFGCPKNMTLFHNSLNPLCCFAECLAAHSPEESLPDFFTGRWWEICPFLDVLLFP